MNSEKQVKDFLDSNNVKYTLHKIPENIDNSVASHLDYLDKSFSDGCATLLFSTENGFVALMRRDDTKVNSKRLKKELGVKSLRFATKEELKRETGFDPGLVSPLNLKMPVYLDMRVADINSVVVATGIPNLDLEINSHDLIELSSAKVIDACDINQNITGKQRILTGDRPTGPLHLGHYIGSLKSRVELQNDYEQYVLIADVQALTDNYANPEKVRRNTLEVYKDYLAVGIDPKKTKIFIQSMIPEIAELTVFFMNLVSHNEVLKNPTVKTEIAQKEFGERVPFGFVGYPVSQAADILFVKGNLVPVGEDQLPVIELAQQIAKRFNSTYGVDLFPVPEAKLSKVNRLIGTDGGAKMSKSLGNVINLKDDEKELKSKVMKMYTDPNRIKATDPGRVEGNPVFIYHDAFNNNESQVEELKSRYREGKVGDVEVKELLFESINNLLAPMREKRGELEEKGNDYLLDELIKSTLEVKKIAQSTMLEVKTAMQINY